MPSHTTADTRAGSFDDLIRQQDDQTERIAAYEDEIAKLKSEITELKRKNAEHKRKNAELENRNAELEPDADDGDAVSSSDEGEC